MAKPRAPAISLDPRYADMLEREKKEIRKKYNKVKPGKELPFARLVEQAARCRVLLDLLFEDLSQNGWTELFSQSPNTPPYERERPAARLYASYDKNYLAILKQLDGYSADATPQTEPDALEMFLR